MDTINVGIIGYGIVGSAMKHTFEGNVDFHISDPKIKDSKSIGEVVKQSQFVFVCVPTPMKLNTGAMDCTIIDKVMEEISACDSNPIIIIKSTVIPSKLNEYSVKYPKLRLTMSPEYLTEKSYLNDAINLRSLVVGGNNREDCVQVINLFLNHSNCRKGFGCGITDLIGAGVLKYMENCYLALKVTFMNQMYAIHKESGSKDSWENVAKVFHLDSRMGNSHYMVPGPDGDFGWGGKCFPKDINAMIHYAKSLGVDIDIMEKAWEINKRIRNDKDWLRIEGATS